MKTPNLDFNNIWVYNGKYHKPCNKLVHVSKTVLHLKMGDIANTKIEKNIQLKVEQYLPGTSKIFLATLLSLFGV